MRVLKIGGNELSDPGFIVLLGKSVAHLLEETNSPLVIVHGGGRAIAGLQTQLGLEVVKVDGLRVTDLESLNVTQMVLSGQSNKTVVKALLAAGVDALGLSGVDGGLLRCRKKEHPTADLGYVGEIVEVRSDLLEKLMGLGLTPVLSPISLGVDGHTYNVNADEAASAVAGACQAEELVFVSNVPGVLCAGELVPSLSAAEAEEYIEKGIINGGMVPKVRSALQAVAYGADKVRIVNLPGLLAGEGTTIVR
ncbi:MAG: acetylglutamate kinase [Candidatus Promineifilaceae bacterium]|jgi:acetylglutamate kinase